MWDYLWNRSGRGLGLHGTAFRGWIEGYGRVWEGVWEWCGMALGHLWEGLQLCGISLGLVGKGMAPAKHRVTQVALPTALQPLRPFDGLPRFICT